MSKFLTSELHQPNFMLEKARGIHLWLFWIITSAQFYISISLLSVLPKETSCIQEQTLHCLWAARIQGQNSTAGSAPHRLTKRQACTPEGKAWSWECHWEKPLQALRGSWPHGISPTTCSLCRGAVLTPFRCPGDGRKGFCQVFFTACVLQHLKELLKLKSSGMHTNDKYASEAIN